MFSDYSDCWANNTNQIVTLGCIPDLVLNVIYFGLDLAGTACVIVIALSGIKYIRAKGDPKDLLTAKQSLIYAVVGLTVILTSFSILHLIAALTGTQCITILNNDFGNCHT